LPSRGESTTRRGSAAARAQSPGRVAAIGTRPTWAPPAGYFLVGDGPVVGPKQW